MSKGELQRESAGLLRGQYGIIFEVSVYYYILENLTRDQDQVEGVHDDISIEFYELEGDNISREELVDLFGEEQVKELEFIL